MDAVGGVVVENVAVYLVFIDALGEQHTDDEIYLGVVGSIGEASRVGHHAGVDTGCASACHGVESSELVNESEHQFAGGTHLRM